ncbi:MAG: NnrU family protein [Hyphomicrobiaceae bacterium]
MVVLVLGLVVFLGLHAIAMNPQLRDGLASRFGESAYKIGFSIASAVGLIVIIYGYHKLQLHPGKNPQIWNPPEWMRHVTLLLMLPSIILLVASLVPSRIRTTVRHPLLLAVKLWALAHLLANGDLGSMILFGSFLAYAVADRISVKKRAALGPLGDKVANGWANDVGVIVAGVLAYAFIVSWAHEALIGVTVAAI